MSFRRIARPGAVLRGGNAALTASLPLDLDPHAGNLQVGRGFDRVLRPADL
jgi:hypothetical protein